MTISDIPSADGSSDSEASGGESPSLPGSSSSIDTAAATEPSLAEKVKAARAALGWSNNRLDKEAHLGTGTSKRIEDGQRVPGPEVLGRLGASLGIQLTETAPQASQAGVTTERRPSATGRPSKRRLFGGKARAGGAAPSSTPTPSSRPSYKRVSTSPVTQAILTFATGGLAKMGQAPLASVMQFTAPVAGEIVDDVIAGTLPDKVIQPFVRGSEKYQNISALFACWASVAWATNVPESEAEAFALFRWSMLTLLPLQGKEMVKRAKAEQKMLEAWEEVQPELVRMFGPDPIAGIWGMMYAQPEQPAPAEEPAAV